MDRIKTSLTRNAWYWLTLCVGTVVFYMLNVYTPLRGDDYEYAMIPGHEGVLCTTLWQYVSSMPFFYQDTNGRIADMIVRFISSLLGRDIFNVLNAMVFPVFVHSLVSLVTTERRAWMLSCVFLYLLLLFPFPGQTMLWLAGSVNYMWSATASMLLLRYMVGHRDGKVTSRSLWRHAALLVAAFIAGGMNESISFATLAGMCGYFIFNHKRWHGTNVTITFAYLAGTILILSSPAAWSRLDAGNSISLKLDMTQMAFNHVYNFITKTGHYVTPFLGLLVICVMLRRRGFKDTVGNLFNCVLVGTVISVLIFGVDQQRAYTWYSLMGLVVVASPLVSRMEGRRVLSRWLLAVTAVASIGVSCYVMKVCRDNKLHDEEVISALMDSPEGVVKAYPTPADNRFYYTLKYNNDDETCYTKFIGYFYGKENVAFIGDSLYCRYKSELPFMHGAVAMDYASESPQWASGIYSFDGAPYTVVPIECDSVTDRTGLHSKLFYNDLEAHVGANFVKKRTRQGKMRDYQPYNHYHLKREGKLYVIMPELNDSITRIEIPIVVGKNKDVLIFNHK